LRLPAPFGLLLRPLVPTSFGLPAPLLPVPRMIIASQIQEDRFQIRLDRRQFRNVQTLISKQLGNNGKVQRVITKADFEKSTGQRLDGKA
jgi:hypothetical protein